MSQPHRNIYDSENAGRLMCIAAIPAIPMPLSLMPSIPLATQQRPLPIWQQHSQRVRQQQPQPVWQHMRQPTPQHLWHQTPQRMAPQTRRQMRYQMAQQEMMPRYLQPIALPLTHVPLAPLPVPNVLPLYPHVPWPQNPYAQHPVAGTVRHTYNSVPRVAAVPFRQPNDSASGPMFYHSTNPVYCCCAPECAPAGIMVPSCGFENIVPPQQSAARNPYIPQQYDPSRANPYPDNGGHVDSRRHSPEYNVDPFGFQRDDAQSTPPQYYHSYSGPSQDGTNNNVESTPDNAAHLEVEDDLPEREIENTEN